MRKDNKKYLYLEKIYNYFKKNFVPITFLDVFLRFFKFFFYIFYYLKFFF